MTMPDAALRKKLRYYDLAYVGIPQPPGPHGPIISELLPEFTIRAEGGAGNLIFTPPVSVSAEPPIPNTVPTPTTTPVVPGFRWEVWAPGPPPSITIWPQRASRNFYGVWPPPGSIVRFVCWNDEPIPPIGDVDGSPPVQAGNHWAYTQTTLLAATYRDMIANIGGLVGYWPLDETTGTTAYDRSTGGRNGGYNGTFTLAAVPLKGSNRVRFTSGAYVDVPNVPVGILSRNPFSLEFWGFLDTMPAGSTGYMAVAHRTAGTNGYWLGRLTSGYTGGFIAAPSLGMSAANGTPWVANQWRHVVFTSDGTTVRLYEQGTIRILSAMAVPTVPVVTNFRINSDNLNVVNPFVGNATGSVCDVAFYSRALTDQEIAAHANWTPPATP